MFTYIHTYIYVFRCINIYLYIYGPGDWLVGDAPDVEEHRHLIRVVLPTPNHRIIQKYEFRYIQIKFR